MIHQAVLNLAAECMRLHAPGGRITSRLQRKGDFARDFRGDTGKGIAAGDRSKIFQLFFTTRPGGTGIGLANTFRFVQLHNGRIEFDSVLGAGTTFRVKLPLASVNEPVVPSFAKVVISANRLPRKKGNAEKANSECGRAGALLRVCFRRRVREKKRSGKSSSSLAPGAFAVGSRAADDSCS